MEILEYRIGISNGDSIHVTTSKSVVYAGNSSISVSVLNPEPQILHLHYSVELDCLELDYTMEGNSRVWVKYYLR